MKGYKTSKDYTLLWELIQKGYRVPGWAWSKRHESWDIIQARSTDFGYTLGSRGVGYNWKEGKEGFMEACKMCDLEFIPPETDRYCECEFFTPKNYHHPSEDIDLNNFRDFRDNILDCLDPGLYELYENELSPFFNKYIEKLYKKYGNNLDKEFYCANVLERIWKLFHHNAKNR